MSEKHTIGDRIFCTYINDEWLAMYTGFVLTIVNITDAVLDCVANEGYKVTVSPGFGDVIKKYKRRR